MKQPCVAQEAAHLDVDNDCDHECGEGLEVVEPAEEEKRARIGGKKAGSEPRRPTTNEEEPRGGGCGCRNR